MKNLTTLLIGMLMLWTIVPASGMNIGFTGGTHKVITDKSPVSTGLDAIYTVYNIKEVTSLEISGIQNPADFKVQVYSNLGGGFAIDTPAIINGSTASLANPKGDMGYIVYDGSHRYCFWIVDYATKHFRVSSITGAMEQGCDDTRLTAEGSGDAIRYYSISGMPCTLTRGIVMEYSTLEWDATNKNYLTVEKSSELESFQNPITIRPALLCNTVVKISGDRFMREWGEEESAESEVITANGLTVNTEAVQTNLTDESDTSNMIKGNDEMLGGSAPVDFTFYAYTSDAVIHNEWQIADDPDFEYIRYRFNEQDLTYTFNEEGKYYVRFIGSNADGSCEVTGDTYNVGIGSSELRIPNAFSPDGDGVNDVWKVGYRSLIQFKCWIFDRNGRQLFYFDRPELGWDGKHNGKTVSPGVYYYVIEAIGADGKKYKKGGDINILRYRKLGEGAGIPSE